MTRLKYSALILPKLRFWVVMPGAIHVVLVSIRTVAIPQGHSRVVYHSSLTNRTHVDYVVVWVVVVFFVFHNLWTKEREGELEYIGKHCSCL